MTAETQQGPPLPGRRATDFLDRAATTSPARLALLSFAGVVAVFAFLLSLPLSHADLSQYSLARSVFVAVSAVCVTGLTPVITENYWSDFGIGVITAGIQVGGLGILTLASVLGMAVSGNLGVRQRLIAAQATNTAQLGQIGSLLRTVVITIFSAEAVVFAFLVPRFLIRGEAVHDALWYSLFYSISAFNNAGFTVHEGGMAHFADDPWILTVIMLAVFVGSLGFPVIFIITVTKLRPRRWDLHSKLTLVTSATLVAIGFAFLLTFEHANPQTFGGEGAASTSLQALFTSMMTRSGGFNTVDVASFYPSSHLVLDILMFIGGGSSSTAGGIKVTTLAVLVLAAWSEARGLTDVAVFRRRIDPAVVKVAISVTLAGTVIVVGGTLAMLQVTHKSLDLVLFEVISAFGTCGLSSGVTAAAPDSGLYILSALMFLGRLGTITLAAALSQASTRRLFRYPEERPIIG